MGTVDFGTLVSMEHGMIVAALTQKYSIFL
jgi:hypothetical protein